MILKLKPANLDRDDYKKYLIESDPIDLFDVTDPNIDLPENARIFLLEICEVCGKKSSEQFIRLQEGKKVCLDCYRDYKRFF